MLNEKNLLTEVLRRDYFTGSRPAIPYFKGGGNTKLVLVLGDNASGKSFFGRVTSSLCYLNKIECMRVGMEGRQTGGFERAFIYGDESSESTGVNSIHVVLTGMRTCEGRTTPHVMFWDEPDLGLSDNTAAGIGVRFHQFAQAIPEKTLGAFIVTHSKALVSQLVDLDPTYLYFGGVKVPQTLQDWLDAPVVPADLDKVQKRTHLRYKRI